MPRGVRISLIVLLHSVLLAAVLILFPVGASAHGYQGDAPTVVEVGQDPEHEADGHPGHCHGGPFCNWVATIIVPPTPPGLSELANRASVPRRPYRVLPPLGFDPPPPKLAF